MPKHASRLWIAGVKAASKSWYKTVGSYAHFPHIGVDSSAALPVMPTTWMVFPSFIQTLSTDLSTYLQRLSPGVTCSLSTVSTPPIITTITYINRRGAAQ